MFAAQDIDPAVTGRRDERKHVVVRFFLKSVPNAKRSREMRSPQFDDQEYCEIKFRGDAKSINVGPAHEPVIFMRDDHGARHYSYAEFYADQYAVFKAGEAQKAAGTYTPIEMLTSIPPSQISTLKAMNIHSVEALEEIEPQHLRKLGTNGQALRTAAEEYIEAAKRRFDAAALETENAELRARLERLETMMKGATEPEEAEPEEGEAEFATEFKSWSLDALRAFLTDQTGEEPSANAPAHILRKMAVKVAAEKAKAKAAA